MDAHLQLMVDVLEENQSGTTRYNVNYVVNAAGSNCSKVMETLTGCNGLVHLYQWNLEKEAYSSYIAIQNKKIILCPLPIVQQPSARVYQRLWKWQTHDDCILSEQRGNCVGLVHRVFCVALHRGFGCQLWHIRGFVVAS